jgi:hypothetical protein
LKICFLYPEILEIGNFVSLIYNFIEKLDSISLFITRKTGEEARKQDENRPLNKKQVYNISII